MVAMLPRSFHGGHPRAASLPRGSVSPFGPLAVAGYQAHRFLAGALVLGVDAAHGARNGDAARLLDAPYRHAEVIRLHHDDGPLRPEASVEGVGHLGSEALLELGTTRVTLHDPGQLREPPHLAAGYVDR